MSVDKKHRQLTLIDPNAPPASDGSRRVGVAAPKMFAFDALFTQEDSQVIKNINLTMHTVQCIYNIICTVENTIDALYTCIVIIINIIIISASNPPQRMVFGQLLILQCFILKYIVGIYIRINYDWVLCGTHLNPRCNIIFDKDLKIFTFLSWHVYYTGRRSLL